MTPMRNSTNSFAVLFDVDGTMVNNTAYHKAAWMEMTRKLGLDFTEKDYHEKIHARSNDKIVRNLFDNPSDEVIKNIADEKEVLYRSTFAPHLKEIPGLLRFLMELEKAGIACGAVSNSPQENVDFVLDGLNLRRFFKVAINRDMVKVGKPDPEGLLRAADELGFPAAKCIVFDDSASGFRACRNAKMKCIAITAATDPIDLAETHDAVGIFNDFSTVTLQTISNIMQAK
jgi:HAD superfamily hydrolase (TIGR01509 family)